MIRKVQKRLEVLKGTQRTVVLLCVQGIASDFNQTVRYTRTTYRIERFGCSRNAFPINGEGDGEAKLPLLDFAAMVKNEPETFMAEALVEYLSEDLVA
jgi:hypothetical protein